MQKLQEALKRHKDPKFDTIDEYIEYYESEMTQTMEYRLYNLQDQHKTDENKIKNRYTDILPYKHTQPHFYYNGNYVKLGDQKFFLSQAPLDILEFHDLVYNMNASQIIQVSPFIERAIPKVARYVPLCENESKKFLQESVEAGLVFEAFYTQKKVSTIDKTKLPFYKNELITQNQLQVKSRNFQENELFYQIEIVYTKNNSSKTVNYQYFKNWSDQLAPSNIQHLFDFCKQIHSDSNDITIIHCSAGVGRSATTAICLYLYQQLKILNIEYNQLDPSIFDCVEELRLTRNPICIQTKEQFRFLFEFANFVQSIR